jgi:hypothetical protein
VSSSNLSLSFSTTSSSNLFFPFCGAAISIASPEKCTESWRIGKEIQALPARRKVLLELEWILSLFWVVVD